MPYKPTWKDRLEDAQQYAGPLVAGVVVLVLAGWMVWFVLKPREIARPLLAPPKDEVARSAAVQRVAREVEVLEQTYQRSLAAGTSTEAASAMLNRVIEKQRELLLLEPTPTRAETEKLAALEAARGSQRSQVARARSVELEKEAIAARAAGRERDALEKMREALRLQREANASARAGEPRDVPRESRLEQAIDTAEAEPLQVSIGAAMSLARAAAAQEKWEEAAAAFAEARKSQAELNRRFPASPHADPAAISRIDGELQTLRAAGIFATLTAKEREADFAARSGRSTEAAAAYARAVAAQRELNEKFALSRYASAPRLDDLEARRQTVLSEAGLARVVAVDTEVAAALRHRLNTGLREKLAEAAKLLETTAAECPRSRLLDPVLQRRVGYLLLRAGELDALQEQVYSRLAPLPGSARFQLLRSEVPQELYTRVMNANPSRNAGRALPVDSVSWAEARECCERLSWLLGRRVRLPTEAEFRAAWTPPGPGAWSLETSDGRSRETGKSPASPLGFHDLAGNLAEWLQPSIENGDTAPVAAGSYLDPADVLRALTVMPVDKREHARHIGFRFVVEFALD